ncbi:hypothetical protein G9F31_08295 [Acinetobacter sp. 187]|uniref:hypothetical protein n=1 Tax=Acinetobacter lanii TaxID=2715163 RepID=UPI00140CFB6D|nr:hypothetical protein [Acinetobacter lanii]NHC03773.1 hypothetical protein [Acinetobacter lanii]
MNVLKSATQIFLSLFCAMKVSAYANHTLIGFNPISDDDLRQVSAASRWLDVANLNHVQHQSKRIKQAQWSLQNEALTADTNAFGQDRIISLFNHMQSNPATQFSMQDNQIVIQLNNVHFERIEVDMNINGLKKLMDPLNMTQSLMTGAVVR